MILIADGGSTKTDWALVEGKEIRNRFKTCGMNPFNVSETTMKAEIAQRIIPNAPSEKVKEIFIYASGCAAKVKQREVIAWFAPYYPNAQIFVEGDLLGAARAACGRTPAIAAILGTGSNSCLYDGKNIVENVPSLGYVLCDEGAGTNIGKILLRDYLRGRMPKHILDRFAQKHKGEESDFLNKLYKEEAPNQYLASFARFAIENRAEDYCRGVLLRVFESFFAEQITAYTDYNNYPLNGGGSIGYHASEELKEVAERYKMRVERVVAAPLEALVEYHVG